MSRRKWWVASLVVLAIPSNACSTGKGCTDRGCGLALSLELAAPIGTPGTYVVRVETEGGAAECSQEIIIAADCLPGTAGTAGTGVGLSPAGSTTVSPGCLQSRLYPEFDACGRLTALVIPDAVAEATIRIQQPGFEPAVEAAVKPDYHESRPNGDECPPVCRTATVTIGGEP